MNKTPIQFNIDDGATVLHYSDSTAYTVIDKTKSGKTITLQADKATLSPDFKPKFIAGGFGGHCTNNEEQSYEYAREPEGPTVKATLRKDGTWRASGTKERVVAGRRTFYDYNF